MAPPHSPPSSNATPQSQGRLTISPTGFLWRKASGGNAIEIKKEGEFEQAKDKSTRDARARRDADDAAATQTTPIETRHSRSHTHTNNQRPKPTETNQSDIAALTWTPVGPRGCQLGVQGKAGEGGAAGPPGANFLGFRDQDLEALRAYCSGVLGVPLAQREMATAGRNWGEVELRGGSLAFLADAPAGAGAAPGAATVRKVAFEVPLSDVVQAQQAKDEVVLEFHVDDTATGDREDVLIEAVFVVPPGNKAWAPPAVADGDDDDAEAAAAGGDGAENNKDKPAPPRPAKVLLDALLPLTDAVGAGPGGAGDEPVTTFEGVAVLQPRGRFDVELYGSYLRLLGQSQEFKIRYASVPRVAVLPRPASPHTLVVLALDPPMRKGQTFYSFLVAQFPSADTLTVRIADHMSDEAIAAKNERVSEVFFRSPLPWFCLCGRAAACLAFCRRELFSLAALSNTEAPRLPHPPPPNPPTTTTTTNNQNSATRSSARATSSSASTAAPRPTCSPACCAASPPRACPSPRPRTASATPRATDSPSAAATRRTTVTCTR